MTSEIPEGSHKLKLGNSFNKKYGDAYHTIKYDFKPASLEVCKESYVDFMPNGETTVSFPKIDAADNIKDVTLFKGSRKPYQKECLLIYDHETGEFTLEDLKYCVQLKQVRSGEEEKEKNVQYAKQVRQKCRHAFQQICGTEATKASVSNDLVMSDEESDLSSSSSSNSDEEAEEKATETNKSESEEDGEDDMAKSLEAVVATSVPKIESSISHGQIKTESNLSLAKCRPVSEQTLHDDLHLSDSSDD